MALTSTIEQLHHRPAPRDAMICSAHRFRSSLQNGLAHVSTAILRSEAPLWRRPLLRRVHRPHLKSFLYMSTTEATLNVPNLIANSYAPQMLRSGFAALTLDPKVERDLLLDDPPNKAA